VKNSYEIIFHPKAEKEYLESVEWYENALVGLGEAFVDEIEKSISRISKNPHLFPLIKFQFRQVVVKKFPFVIVFEIKQTSDPNSFRLSHKSKPCGEI
jgi:hypothetical protein